MSVLTLPALSWGRTELMVSCLAGHKFIVNGESTPWYEGSQIKVYIKATSPEQVTC
jgi:hypothetical protein